MRGNMRRAARIDDNQNAIVDALRSIPGVTVELGHDDIMVGHKGQTYWYEVKDPGKCFLADGVTFKKGSIKPSQIKLRETWAGHYKIVWSLDMILEDMGIKNTPHQPVKAALPEK